MKKVHLKLFNKNISVLRSELDNGLPTIIFFHGFPDDYHVWENINKSIGSSYNQVCLNLSDFLGLKQSRIQLYFLKIIDALNIPLNQGLYFLGHDIGGPFCHLLCDVIKKDLKGVIFLNSFDIVSYRENFLSKQMLKSWYALFFQSSLIRLGIKKSKSIRDRLFNLVAKEARDINSVENIDHYQLFFGFIFSKKRKELFLPENTFFIFSKDDNFLSIPSKNKIHYEVQVLRGGHWDLFEKDHMVSQIVLKKLESWERIYA
ncbi:MAG: hypothetical protein CME61_02030 [Halobacteriovoraceae bacterium]|nr:hypothetical protein [Halobacteriovoraceae bacterium]